MNDRHPAELDVLLDDARTATKTLGLVFMVLGLIMVLFPTATTVGLAIYVGATMLIAGVLALALGWKVHREAGWTPVVGGSLFGIIGLVIVFNPSQSAAALTGLITFFLVIEGAIGGVMALARRDRGWGMMLFASVASVLLGVLLWQNLPTSASWLFGTFVGIVLLVRGAAYVYVAHLVGKELQA